VSQLKTIDYRGGVIRFRIPANWREEYEEEGGATFYADDEPSGTLRLNILTFEGSAVPGREELLDTLRRDGAVPEWLPTGHAFSKQTSEAEEDGVAITVFLWQLASGVAPRHLRIAVFSYTLDTRDAGSRRALAEQALLEAEIRAAPFAPELGVTAEPSVSELQPADFERLAAQRAVVEAYLGDDEARRMYQTTAGKLRLLRGLLQNKVFRPDQTHELQSLGIVFGDALVQELGLRWVVVADGYGRDPALGLEGTSVLVYPLTMISKRVEDGEAFDVVDLFNGIAEKIEELK